MLSSPARSQAQGPESPVGSSISLGSFQVLFFAPLVQKVNVSVHGDLVESINLELANNANSWTPPPDLNQKLWGWGPACMFQQALWLAMMHAEA